jgi:hypothetical protein
VQHRWNFPPLVGLLAWLGLAAWLGPRLADEATLAELAISFVALVIVPLALPQTRAPGRLYTAVTVAHAIAAPAVLLGAAFVPTGTPTSIALATSWLGFTGLAALHALARLRRRGDLRLAELAIDLGLLFLPGAAVWLLVYRGEWVLGGFGGLGALLTAGHFHAAGFGVLILTGLLGRGLADLPRARGLYRLVAPMLMLAFPLLAAGIGAAVRPLELAGAGLYALGLPLLAGLQIAAAVGLRGRPKLGRALLVVSSLAVLLSTGFAVRFAAQGFYGAAVQISTMLRWHALVNVVGLLGCGLLAWSRLAPPEASPRRAADDSSPSAR